MRKYLIVFALSLFIFNSSQAQEKLKIIATASMIADMAKNIAGDKMDVECIVPIGGDPHTYEPTPRDVKLVVSGDIILMNGLTFEGWLTDLIKNSGTKAKTHIVTKGINAITAIDHANSTDPHAWMDFTFGYQYILNIKNALIEADPSNKVYYEARHDAYLDQLKAADKYVMNKIKTIPEDRRILITSHDAFQYYGRRYGIRLEAVMGVSTDSEIKTSDVIRLNKIIEEFKVPAVFIESTVNPKFLQQLSKDNDIVIGGELFADSIGDEDSEAPTYIDMLKHNTDVIVAALTNQNTSNEFEDHEQNSPAVKIVLYGILGVLCIGGFLLMLFRVNKG